MTRRWLFFCSQTQPVATAQASGVQAAGRMEMTRWTQGIESGQIGADATPLSFGQRLLAAPDATKGAGPGRRVTQYHLLGRRKERGHAVNYFLIVADALQIQPQRSEGKRKGDVGVAAADADMSVAQLGLTGWLTPDLSIAPIKRPSHGQCHGPTAQKEPSRRSGADGPPLLALVQREAGQPSDTQWQAPGVQQMHLYATNVADAPGSAAHWNARGDGSHACFHTCSHARKPTCRR